MFDNGDSTPPRLRYFFERQWLLDPEFKTRVEQRWVTDMSKFDENSYSMHRWHGCLTRSRQLMRGLDTQTKGAKKQRREELMGQLESWDRTAEHQVMSPGDWQNQFAVEKLLNDLFNQEAVFWQQRGKVKWLLQGDNNTRFFQLMANGRHRKNEIKYLNTKQGQFQTSKR